MKKYFRHSYWIWMQESCKKKLVIS